MKNFMGPEPWLAILLFPIEIFSHLARILSLTIRLYANMFASDLVTLVFFSLVPLAFRLCSSCCTSAYRLFRPIFSCCWRRCTSEKRWRTSIEEAISN